MKKIILFNCLIFMTLVSYAQEENIGNTRQKNIVSLHIGYPFPNSGSTFNRIYDGLIDISIGYSRAINKLYVGGDFGYSDFKINTNVLDKNGTMTILSPGITIGYKFDLWKALHIQTACKVSYDFIKFEESEKNSFSSYQNDAMAVLPEISLNYLISRNIEIGLVSSYKIIFQRFGNQAVYENSTTRIIIIGINISYLL